MPTKISRADFEAVLFRLLPASKVMLDCGVALPSVAQTAVQEMFKKNMTGPDVDILRHQITQLDDTGSPSEGYGMKKWSHFKENGRVVGITNGSKVIRRGDWIHVSKDTPVIFGINSWNFERKIIGRAQTVPVYNYWLSEYVKIAKRSLDHDTGKFEPWEFIPMNDRSFRFILKRHTFLSVPDLQSQVFRQELIHKAVETGLICWDFNGLQNENQELFIETRPPHVTWRASRGWLTGVSADNVTVVSGPDGNKIHFKKCLSNFFDSYEVHLDNPPCTEIGYIVGAGNQWRIEHKLCPVFATKREAGEAVLKAYLEKNTKSRYMGPSPVAGLANLVLKTLCCWSIWPFKKFELP